MGARAPYAFFVKRLHETKQAILITDADDDDAVWLPKSQIEVKDEKEKEDGTYILIEIPEWLAQDKGLL